MALTVRNSALARVAAGAPWAVPFAALPDSTLLLFMLTRSPAGTYPDGMAPAGWTTSYRGHPTGAVLDQYQLCTAPGTTVSVPATAQVGEPNRVYVLLEVTGADPSGIAADVGAVVWGATATTAAVVPSAVGAPGLAVALAMGTTGDPGAGCYWSDRAGWTKDQCSTFGAGGFHPWWAVYTRPYPAMPASVQESFDNTIGQTVHAALFLLPPAAGAPGVMPRIW